MVMKEKKLHGENLAERKRRTDEEMASEREKLLESMAGRSESAGVVSGMATKVSVDMADGYRGQAKAGRAKGKRDVGHRKRK